ncbi:MAG: ATP-binding protein [Anaerolineales bacterium]
MIFQNNLLRKTLEHSLPWLVLGVLLFYTYIKFFQHPYGFSWGADGKVFAVFVDQPHPLLVGDQIVQVGQVEWEEFQNDLRVSLFDGVNVGEIVPVIVERDGERLTIPWKLPGINEGEVWEQLASEWPIAYFFWLAGTLTLLFLRPKDERWLLLSAFNFLTSIWLATGGGASGYHIFYSAIILRVMVWLCVPIYLHFHWVFPRPLGKLPPFLIWGIYAVSSALMIAQWFQWLPANLYLLGFLIAIVGSIILLIAHAIKQPDVRRELRVLLITMLFILVPLVILGVVQSYPGIISRLGSFALLPFPLLPFAYLYAAYRRQLGGAEIRVNRLISIYLYVIAVFTLGLPVLAALYNLFLTTENMLFIGIFTVIIASLISIWTFPFFQNFVERRLLGITMSGQNLPQVYSARITTSTSLVNLLKLLEEDIFPSLLVTQYAFVRFTSDLGEIILSKNLTKEQLHKETISDLFLSLRAESSDFNAGGYKTPEWIRLILPLKLDKELMGVWLLGRRDPDDLYPQAEIPILRSLADQTTIALSNILYSERLLNLYANDIERNEQSRMQLALELHDNVLNQLAILRLNTDETTLSSNFENAYKQVITHLREIVSDLRPPMLAYGLRMAIKSLEDKVMIRTQGVTKVTMEFENENNIRYPENVERHIFRIVQQACDNAIQHGKATEIHIRAGMDVETIWVSVEDNGVGFEAKGTLNLEMLLENRHFGLAGMIERATFINASVDIDSDPNKGTRVQVTWKKAT